MNRLLRAFAAASCGLWIGAPSFAAGDCSTSTKAKLADVDASQADRDALCAEIGSYRATAQATFTVADFRYIAKTGQRLRSEGYRSASMHHELIVVAAVRPSSDIELLANAYAKSNKCLTPGLVAQDVINALRDSPDAAKMYQGWDRDFFTKYVVMVGYQNGCSFR